MPKAQPVRLPRQAPDVTVLLPQCYLCHSSLPVPWLRLPPLDMPVLISDGVGAMVSTRLYPSSLTVIVALPVVFGPSRL